MKNISSRIGARLKRVFNDPFARIRKLPRYTPGEVVIKGNRIAFPDAPSFMAIYDEIFDKHVYRFLSPQPAPLIIDCGANIGISTIYFKQLYPQSRVIAFEPDAAIYAYLEKNVAAMQAQGVTLVNKGVWSEDKELEFLSEGADSGKVASGHEKTEGKTTRIKVERLSTYINEKVAFLKIDIEGAELEVLKEIEHKLPLVENIFIEYHSFENREQDLDQILRILTRQGLRYYIYAPTTLRNQPFVDKASYNTMDGMLNICASRS